MTRLQQRYNVSTEALGLILVLISAAGYAILPIVLKLGYLAVPNWNPVNVVFWRFVIATPLVWLLVIARRDFDLRRDFQNGAGPMLFAGLIFSSNAVMTFVSLTKISAALFSLILYLYPAFVAIFGLVLGHRLNRAGWGALSLALVGSALTVGRGLEGGSADPLGILLAVSTAVFYAIYIVYSGHHSSRLSMLNAGAFSITGTLIGVMAYAFWQGAVALPPATIGWLYVGILATVSTVLPIITFLIGITHLGAARAALISTVEPVITVLVAALFLGDLLHPIQWVGGALILASVIWLQLSTRAESVKAKKAIEHHHAAAPRGHEVLG